jgi:DNA invertase Pin-like site-specific DNA recombinase
MNGLLSGFEDLLGLAPISNPVVGFWGRVSDKDLQDPSLSLPRQADAGRWLLDILGVRDYSRFYWDIESGLKRYADRGAGADPAEFNVSIRRDGGFEELLADAKRGLFNVLIVEQIDRVARRTSVGTRVEDELAEHGVVILAADEGLAAGPSAILIRRVKQALAEFIGLDMKIRSRNGMTTSVKQGWHPGGPCPYGYQLEPHPHPNPNKAREGKRKHKLIVDPVCGPIVTRIFSWYCIEGLSLDAIVERLNGDLDRYPPPKRNKKDENGLIQTWAKSQVQSMLRNPRYTGFNVWNRHDHRKGRPCIRPREQWVWSDEQTHEPLVSKELFAIVEQRADERANRIKAGRSTNYSQRRGKNDGRYYPLRGRVYCELCGRRLEPSFQKGNCYRCTYTRNRGDAAAEASGHPKSLQISERILLRELYDFLADRVFGPDRLKHLQEELADAGGSAWRDRERKLAKLDRELEQANQAIKAQVAHLDRYNDPDHPAAVAIHERIDQLAAKERALIAELDRVRSREPEGIDPNEVARLLEGTPDLRPALATYTPEEIADLVDAFDVRIHFNSVERSVRFELTLVPTLLTAEAKTPARLSGRRKLSYARVAAAA